MSVRAERAAEAQRLCDEGLAWQEACAAMGISRTYYFELLQDPEGRAIRARKASYRGTCKTCGRQTDGSNGPSGAPDECSPCRHRREHEERRWTREAVIAAVCKWAVAHGRPPRPDDWRRAGADHPATSTVVVEVGWSNAIEAAGFEARRFNTPLLDDPSLLDEVAQRYRSGETSTYLASRFGVSVTRICQWLDMAGVPRRSQSEAQRLRYAAGRRNGKVAA